MKTSEKNHITEIGKKIAAILLALGLVCGIGAAAVACEDNTEQGGQENTDNRQPENPEGEDKDDGDNTGNTNDDIGGSGNPDGDIGEPENPGGDIGEPEDPDDNIEEPENPDGNTETPGGNTEDQKIPFVIDTVDELMEYRLGTLYNTLNEKFMDGILYRCTFSHDYTYQNATNIEWTILESSQTDISKVQVRFNITTGNTYRYYVGEATFNEPISVQDFANGNITQIMIDNTTNKSIYGISAIADQMEQNQPLAEAIVTKLGGTLADSDLLLLTMDNASTDPVLHEVRIVYVKQITATGINQFKVTIAAKNGSGDISHLISNLQTNQYKDSIVENNVISLAPAFDDNSLDKQTPEFEPDLADNG